MPGKKLVRTNQPGKLRRSRKRVIKKRKQAPAMMDHGELAIARMLTDPCNAPLIGGFLPGDRGFVNRFTRINTISMGATNTCFYAVFAPSINAAAAAAVTNTSTTIVGSLDRTLGPGYTYLNNNAYKLRSTGACLQVWSDVAPLSVTGNVAYGVVPIQAVQDGSAKTIAGVSQLLSHVTKLTANSVELKFSLGANDQFYDPNNVGATVLPPDVDDRNVLVVVGWGLPANSTYTCRLTNIVEWSPKADLGMTVDSSHSGPSPHTIFDVQQKLKAVAPDWNHAVKNTFGTALGEAAAGAASVLGPYARQLGSSLATKAAGFVGELLPALL